MVIKKINFSEGNLCHNIYNNNYYIYCEVFWNSKTLMTVVTMTVVTTTAIKLY